MNAKKELTHPLTRATLVLILDTREVAMIRSGTINTIHELSAQGKSIREIARIVGIARNTVRRYLRGKPIAAPRSKRGSILDSYKKQIRTWITEDHLYKCEVMFPRLHAQGYAGGLSTIKASVQTLRPAKVGQYPIQRYETKPGEQMQYDWGEFHYEKEGKEHKLYGFIAILGYSRMRFITFVKRCDTPTMIRCMMAALEYFDGLPQAALTDRMKSVFLDMDGKTPIWNPIFADFADCACLGALRCRRAPRQVGRFAVLRWRALWPSSRTSRGWLRGAGA